MYRQSLFTVLVTGLLFIGLGCSTNVESIDSSAPAAPAASAPESAAPSPTPVAASHQDLLQQVEQLESAYQQSPADAGVKARLIATKYDYATALMADPQVRPMEKYPTALKAFKEILAMEPEHAKAAEQKQVIEDIYRSMGRPVPQ
jgi:hypothetical protein